MTSPFGASPFDSKVIDMSSPMGGPASNHSMPPGASSSYDTGSGPTSAFANSASANFFHAQQQQQQQQHHQQMMAMAGSHGFAGAGPSSAGSYLDIPPLSYPFYDTASFPTFPHTFEPYQPLPNQQNYDETPEESKLRFELECEFVQALCNPHYLNYLAQRGFFKEATFVRYLKYLTYFKQPNYARVLKYPQALLFLDLLQSAKFREAIASANNAKFIEDQLLLQWTENLRKRARLVDLTNTVRLADESTVSSPGNSEAENNEVRGAATAGRSDGGPPPKRARTEAGAVELDSDS